MPSCFVGFNLDAGEHPSFGIWHNNFFLSYLVTKKLHISIYKNNPYIDIEIQIDDKSHIKIGTNMGSFQIGFMTSGDSRNQCCQSHVNIGNDDHKELKESIMKLIKDEKMHGIEETREVWDDLYKVKTYSLFVKSSRWGYKRVEAMYK